MALGQSYDYPSARGQTRLLENQIKTKQNANHAHSVVYTADAI